MYDMGVWETEDEYSSTPAGAASLPTPSETPYRTPSRNSKRSRRSMTPPGTSSSPPPPMPSDRTDKSSKRNSRDVTTDESISILDPRRFTPTLHASLVSEILSLRRDQEEKIKLIEGLESSLHAAREEQDELQNTLLSTAKESRSLKRQLALLEGGTSSALGELARERDEAMDTIAETKKRLEAAQKKIRAQEDDSQRTHELWAKEKDAWEEEKRKYERRIHVAESRLKMLLEEVAAYQAAQVNGLQQQNGTAPAVAEGEAEDHGRDNDAASIRTMSMTNSIRFSVMNGAPKMNGHSLADELNLDGEDDYETDHDGRQSVLSHNNQNHIRNRSRDSAISSLHKRTQSIESLKRPASVARGRLYANHSVLDKLEGGIKEDDETQPQAPAVRVNYVDSAIQYSPPPSPKLAPSKPSSPEPLIASARLERLSKVESPPREWDIEANQRRKRVHVGRPLLIETPNTSASLMVSSSSQTANDEPLSPPKTPKTPYQEPTPPPLELHRLPEPRRPAMVSSSTQTDPPPLQPSFLQFPPPSIPIISIHPPTSRPTTPREPRLPQQFKDFGCQVSLIDAKPSRTASVQTEEIRIDKRLNQLPPHLHPSAISSRPPTPEVSPVPDDGRHFTPVPGNLPPRNPRRLMSRRSQATPTSEIPSSPPTSAVLDAAVDIYPGNNDDGPLSSQKAPMRRPHRSSSLFAGFDGNSSDEADEFGDADLSDSEFRTALSAPKPKAGSQKMPKRTSIDRSTASPDQAGTTRSASGRSSMRFGGTEVYSKFSLPESRDIREETATATRRPSLRSMARALEKSAATASSSRSSVMRRAAMIQNGIATHAGRARSPSLPDHRDPPFPIPTRASSRKPPISISAPSEGQRSPTRGESWHRRGMGRTQHRANSIRKVRSAAALPRGARSRRHGSRSPPPFPDPPESPGLPPLPSNDITTPRMKDAEPAKYKAHHKSQLSTNTANSHESTGSHNQGTGVVDAIAQTMVGEWMFKYVRRRKSFGVPDGNSRDDSSNDRHKRWVWLAPYERAILWSSKQPSSGSALLGKSGRKRKLTGSRNCIMCISITMLTMGTVTIQSVLDVKDDNPSPKGIQPLFNRSILILTPQRALKFTAISAERHYTWLTALSFLAHSSQAVPEIVAAPPRSTPDLFELPPAKVRKPGIRDSIRLAKGRGGRIGLPMSVTSSSQVSEVGQGSFKHTPEAFMTISEHDMPAGHLANGTVAGGSRDTSNSHGSVLMGGSNHAHHTHDHQNPLASNPIPSNVSTSSQHTRETSREAAEPPYIPRFHERANNVTVHGRKRSNTGGHVPPPLSFRGFSGPAGGGGGSSSSYSGYYHHKATNSTAGNSIGTAASSDIFQQSIVSGTSSGWGGNTWGAGIGAGWSSQRTSEASSRPSGQTMSNFFDAIGTVRMEAFISPLTLNGGYGAGRGRYGDYPDEMEELRNMARRRSKEIRRRNSRSRNRDSYHSRGSRGTGRATATTDGGDYSYGGSRTAGEEDYFRDDPFKGF